MKTVVIIGGSYAGFVTAKSLEKTLNDNIRIILIERRTHFYHSVGGLRAAVEGLEDQVFIPYDKLFKLSSNQVIHAKAIRFDEKSVFLDKSVDGFGDSIAYDFLIIATGTLYPAPAKIYADTLEEGKSQLKHIQQQVKDANNILVIGGGPVGIEFVGEILEKYKTEKKITLIHNNDQLGQASYLNKKANKQLLDILKANNVQVLLNDRIDLPTDITTDSVYQPTTPLPTTKNGVDLKEIDLVMLAFGNRPNVDLVKKNYPDAIHANGYVKVKSTLQVDHPSLSKNVFVIGDAAALDENKMAYHTPFHAAVVTENISRLIKNPSTTDLKHYKHGLNAIVIPVGKSKGVSQLPMGIVAGNWTTSLIKGKTLFFDRYWKEFNQPVPSQWRAAELNEDNNRTSIVCLSAAVFDNRSYRGSPVGLVKRLRNLLQQADFLNRLVYIKINEYNTSQVCSRCGTKALTKYRLNNGEDLYSVLVCLSCGTKWQHDENASRNIRDIFMIMVSDGHRPTVLSPPRRIRTTSRC